MLAESLKCIESMNSVYEQLLDELEEFQRDKDDFHVIGDFKEQEILMSNRLIKKEVIDMADMVESLHAIIEK